MNIESQTISLKTGRRSWTVPAEVGWAPPRSLYSRCGKRITDLIIASLLVVLLLSWMVPLLFVLIRLGSRGPLFFIQQRGGRNGLQFPCIKFRTMRISEERDLHQATAADRRITPIGRFLRKTHIDELPQLINVLANQMSLVGPRPHMLYHDRMFSEMVPGYHDRYLLKPGITGLAQARGYHGPTPDLFSVSHRTRLDLFYVRKLSPGLDAKILLRTLLVLPLNRLRHADVHKR